MQLSKIRVMAGQSQHSFLGQRTLDIIVLHHNVLLERFNSKNFASSFQLRQQNLDQGIWRDVIWTLNSTGHLEEVACDRLFARRT